MVAHLNPEQVEAYCRRRLPAAELLSVSEHLGGCEACRRLVARGADDDAAFSALHSALFAGGDDDLSPPAPGAHLTPEEMALYVDHDLSGESLQAASAHLFACEECALSVDDLRAFREQVAPSLGRELRPAPVDVPAPTPAPAPAAGWWRRAVASFNLPFRVSPLPAFGAALAALLLVLGGWLVWRTTREAGRPQEVVTFTPTPPTPSVVVSPTPAAPTPQPESKPTESATPQPESKPTPSESTPPPPETAAVVARLNDGEGLLTLDREGRLAGAERLPPAYQSLLKKALATGRVERSAQLSGLTRPPSALMGADEPGGGFGVVEPAGRVLLTDRPTFRWTPLEGATGYVVELYDGDFNLVAASPTLDGRSWVAPRALARGGVYSWQVKATRDGQEITSPRPPAPQARFRVLDRAKADELARARRAYPSSHLTLGLLYAEAGLLEEAERELRLLQRANPGSEVARRLLQSVKSRKP